MQFFPFLNVCRYCWSYPVDHCQYTNGPILESEEVIILKKRTPLAWIRKNSNHINLSLWNLTNAPKSKSIYWLVPILYKSRFWSGAHAHAHVGLSSHKVLNETVIKFVAPPATFFSTLESLDCRSSWNSQGKIPQICVGLLMQLLLDLA
jgi:hypothetical protein